jgi:hypothetical protein
MTCLAVADLYFQISDEKLVAVAEAMTFDHVKTHVSNSGGEQSYGKMRPNSPKKKRFRLSSEPPLTKASNAVYL